MTSGVTIDAIGTWVNKKQKKIAELYRISKCSSVSILHRLEYLIFVLGVSEVGTDNRVRMGWRVTPKDG